MDTNHNVPNSASPETGEIWSRFSAELRSFIRRRVNNPDDAEDVLQDVFIRIHNGLTGLADTDRLLPWVYRITRNAIIDHARRRSSPSSLQHDPISNDDLDDQDDSQVLGRCLNLMLLNLPEADREALQSVEVQGMAQTEFAQAVGLSRSGAKSRVQRARQRLKDELLACCEFQFDRLGRPTGDPTSCQDDCGCLDDPDEAD